MLSICEFENQIRITLDYISFPSIIFLLTWLIGGLIYSILDMFQPIWYQKTSVINPKYFKPLNFLDFLTILFINIKNLQIFFFAFFLFSFLRQTFFGETPLFDILFQNYPFYWLKRILFEIIGASLSGEIWFFISHRLAHVPKMSHWHALHHNYSENCYAIVGLYCSWQETLFINFPLGLGWAIIVQMNKYILSLWLSVIAFHVLTDHSGHTIFATLIDNPKYHLDHHKHKHENYGAKWIYDILNCFK